MQLPEGLHPVSGAILDILLLKKGILLKKGYFLRWSGLGCEDFLTNVRGMSVLGMVYPNSPNFATEESSRKLATFIRSSIQRKRRRLSVSCTPEFEAFALRIWKPSCKKENKRKQEKLFDRHGIDGPPWFLREKISHWAALENASFRSFVRREVRITADSSVSSNLSQSKLAANIVAGC